MTAPLNYNQILVIQVASVVFLSLASLTVFFKWKTIQHKYLFIYTFSVFINNLGYLFEITSKTLSQAFMATKFLYMGKVFIPVAILAFVMNFCNVKLPLIVYRALSAFQLFIYFLVLTTGYQKLYYSSVLWSFDGYFPHLVLTHSIFYYVHIILGFMYIIVGYGAIFHYYHHTNSARRRKQLKYIIVAVGFITLSMIILCLGLTSCYDPTSLGYTFCVIFLYIAVIKYDLMDTRDLAKDYSLDNTTAAVIAIDDDGDISYFNKTASQIFPELERNSSEPVHQLDELVATNSPLEKDGKTYLTNINQLYQNNTCTGIIYTLTDETQAVSYTKELEAERDKAEAAYESKSRFVNVVTHEIRTPMNAVVSMTDLILQNSNNLSETNLKYLNNIKTSGQALVMIVNDLLDQSKLEAGKMEIVESPYELRPLIEDVKLLIESRIEQKPIHLLVDIDDNVPRYLIGDSLRIRQILINLMNNSVKFTDEGFIRVGIKGTDIDANRRMLRFSIKDSGQGIKPEDLNRLGEAFSQVDTTKNHTKEGTGLGLSISKNFIELMGGQLEVDSVYGEGTEFFFSIWQGIASSLDMEEQAATDADVSFTTKDVRILVVDDTAVNLEIAEAVLKPLGVTVDTSISGKRALAMVQKLRYDLIFMDYMMPGMNGVEVTAAIRAAEKNAKDSGDEALGNYLRNVPIIGLTGDTSDETKEAFTMAGVDGFTDKPLNTNAIKKVLLKWIDSKKIIFPQPS